jgi:WD40 repeat protein
MFMTSSDDGFIKVWSSDARETAGFAVEEQIGCLAVSPDSVTIACGGRGGHVHFYKLMK